MKSKFGDVACQLFFPAVQAPTFMAIQFSVFEVQVSLTNCGNNTFLTKTLINL